MKIEKKKIAFGIIIGIVLIFIIGYSILLFGNDDDDQKELSEPLVPELKTEQEEYTSKLDALNALKEVRQTNAPSIYDEKLLDSTGLFDLDLLDKKKIQMIDNIYRHGRIDYSNPNDYQEYRKKNIDSAISVLKIKPNLETIVLPPKPTIKEMALEQQLFFASSPKSKEIIKDKLVIHALVDGKHIVKVNDRLELRTINDFLIDGVLVPRNTILYGIVSFKPNRVLLKIENVNHQKMSLKVYDVKDGLEGIYIKNSFRAEASKEIVDDAVEGINVPGVPQIKGLKKIFRRSNRNVKVTVHNNYELILIHKGQIDNRQ